MMISGKEGMLTKRDKAILTDLYFTRILSTEQIARLYFPSYISAKKRLYELRRLKGVVEPMTPESGRTLWTLTKPAFWREAEFVYPDDRYRSFPEERYIPHMLDANDIYVGIRHEFDRLLGEYPAWQWADEARMVLENNAKGNASRGSSKKNQPDAVLTFDVNHYFIERQTHRARKTKEELDKKVDGYRRYFSRLGEPEGEREVIFACDVQRDMENVLESAEKHDVDLSAGTVEDVTGYLIKQAKKAKSARAS